MAKLEKYPSLLARKFDDAFEKSFIRQSVTFNVSVTPSGLQQKLREDLYKVLIEPAVKAASIFEISSTFPLREPDVSIMLDVFTSNIDTKALKEVTASLSDPLVSNDTIPGLEIVFQCTSDGNPEGEYEFGIYLRRERKTVSLGSTLGLFGPMEDESGEEEDLLQEWGVYVAYLTDSGEFERDSDEILIIHSARGKKHGTK